MIEVFPGKACKQITLVVGHSAGPQYYNNYEEANRYFYFCKLRMHAGGMKVFRGDRYLYYSSNNYMLLGYF
jgi:hypothetical protein